MAMSIIAHRLLGLLNTGQEENEKMPFPGPRGPKKREKEWALQTARRGTVWLGPGKPLEITGAQWVSLWAHILVMDWRRRG